MQLAKKTKKTTLVEYCSICISACGSLTVDSVLQTQPVTRVQRLLGCSVLNSQSEWHQGPLADPHTNLSPLTNRITLPKSPVTSLSAHLFCMCTSLGQSALNRVRPAASIYTAALTSTQRHGQNVTKPESWHDGSSQFSSSLKSKRPQSLEQNSGPAVMWLSTHTLVPLLEARREGTGGRVWLLIQSKECILCLK